jgi:Uma2 family endonuclease
MSALPKYVPHYTLADYENWPGEWELWNGVPVAMTPSPFGRHQWIAGEITYQLKSSLRSHCYDCFVLMETDWIISDDTVVRPDVAVVCGSFPERHIVDAPRLIVEVLSPSTESKDRDAKMKLYASQGVEFYLIVDPVKKKIDVSVRDASTGLYCPRTENDPLTFHLHTDCVAQLDAEELFGKLP